ncbi:MAG: hypothetical protein H6722_31585 [Sandaracinus sp.]|nr:hypothetical protein [Myxococcales bacterium]MCB9616995.1 hypothetical protein [Sandaracinus sp.]MCB9622231.1 hypothetical protein [Sandaracinus sp.]
MRSCSFLLLGLVACGPCGSTSSTENVTPPTETAENDTPVANDALYDAEGNLLPSDVVVAGLALPRGLEERPSFGDRRHVYWTNVPIVKVQGYFGRRLITGQVDRIGDAAVFRRAVPQGVRGGIVHLDVGIHPIPRGGGARVEIEEIAPVPQNPPSADELIRRFDEEQRRLD